MQLKVRCRASEAADLQGDAGVKQLPRLADLAIRKVCNDLADEFDDLRQVQ